jgi:RAB protein geranylgeranyltransferase component A
LHLDKNHYYGGFEAALSLEEAEKWQEQVNSGMARVVPQSA